jgi:hypothetical protein
VRFPAAIVAALETEIEPPSDSVLAAAYSAFPMPFAWTHYADTDVYATAP